MYFLAAQDTETKVRHSTRVTTANSTDKNPNVNIVELGNQLLKGIPRAFQKYVTQRAPYGADNIMAYGFAINYIYLESFYVSSIQAFTSVVIITQTTPRVQNP